MATQPELNPIQPEQPTYQVPMQTMATGVVIQDTPAALPAAMPTIPPMAEAAPAPAPVQAVQAAPPAIPTMGELPPAAQPVAPAIPTMGVPAPQGSPPPATAAPVAQAPAETVPAAQTAIVPAGQTAIVPATIAACVEGSDSFVTFDKLSLGRMMSNKPEQKTIPGTGPEAKPPCPAQHYYQIGLAYNYGPQERKIIKDFLIEGCEVTAPYGLQSKQGQSGRIEHALMVRFDPGNPEHNAFIDSMNAIHGGAAYILGQNRGAVKLYNFSPEMAVATGLKNPVYRPFDDVTAQPIEGKSPSMFLKCFKRGFTGMEEKTLFTDPDCKPIPWELLSQSEVTFIPLIHVKHIYVGGGKASIQMEMVSALVTKVRGRNTETMQTTTAERYKARNPQAADMVQGQIASLMAARQDSLLTQADHKQEADTQQHGEGQPTFAGIVPTNHTGQQGQATGQQAQYAGQATGQQAQYAGQATGQTIQDFTAAAPQRQPGQLALPAGAPQVTQFN